MTINDDMGLNRNIEDQMKLIASERQELKDAKSNLMFLTLSIHIITVVDGIPFKAGLDISDDVFNAVGSLSRTNPRCIRVIRAPVD